MSTLVSRGWSAQDAADFMARCLVPHTVQWKADSYIGQSGGGVTLLAKDIPVVGGTLEIDTSDPIRRRLKLEVAGAEGWSDSDPNAPLVPYGQFIRLFVRIDKADGSWFSWLPMGEMQIRSFEFERPSMICTVECSDWAAAVDDYRHTKETGYVGKTLEAAIVDMVNTALPYKVLNPRYVSTKAKSNSVASFVSAAGTSRWAQAQDLADNWNLEVLFDATGALVIRKSRDDNDDNSPSEVVGPDVGTKTNPVATISDGPQGNLVATHLTLSREGGVNGVFFPLVVPAKKQDKKAPGTEGKFYTAKATQASGATAWGDKYGYQPAVHPKTVKTLSSTVKSNYDDLAKTRLRRRRGVLRQFDMDVAGLYWVEADDLVKVKIAGTTEDHFVAAITFDISGQEPARLRTRRLG